MESWTVPQPPRLPGQGEALRLFDTASQQVRPTAPGPEAKLYVCGITPYDATHMGHAATYVAFDTVQRVWMDAGHTVHYVQNVTDIDEPLLERAVATGQDWQELARAETQLFREDMTALGVLPPRAYIGAVESIPSVVRCVEALRERGAVYSVDTDLYFDLSTDSAFGEVSSLDSAAMLAIFGERGGDPLRPGKRHPLDPLLWRSKRPEEPAWDTPLGHGRPGWHIECVAIALDHLGMSFDVQGGGSDLIFPHHEMGAAQAEVMTAAWPYARHYVHTGMVGLFGEKMSKSKGNLVFVSALRRDGVDPSAIRLAILAHHYRFDWEWTDDLLTEAVTRLGRWRQAAGREQGAAFEATLQHMRRVLADDLQSPLALLAMDRWAEETLHAQGRDAAAPALARDAADALLGVRL